jgi:hypothetical protein
MMLPAEGILAILILGMVDK